MAHKLPSRRKLLMARRKRNFSKRIEATRVVKEARAMQLRGEALPQDFDWNRQNIPTWPRVRLATLKRDNHRCRICKDSGTDEVPLQVHHIIPRRWPGSSERLDNLVSLCPPCHLEGDLFLWREYEERIPAMSPQRVREVSRAGLKQVGQHIRSRLAADPAAPRTYAGYQAETFPGRGEW